MLKTAFPFGIWYLKVPTVSEWSGLFALRLVTASWLTEVPGFKALSFAHKQANELKKKKSSWLIKTHAHYYINRGDTFCFKAILGGGGKQPKKPQIGNDYVRCYMQPGVCVDLSGDVESPELCLWWGACRTDIFQVGIGPASSTASSRLKSWGCFFGSTLRKGWREVGGVRGRCLINCGSCILLLYNDCSLLGFFCINC